MAESQAKKSKMTSENLGEQYKDKAFRLPAHYTLAEAVNFADIRERMFAKREQSRSNTIKDPKNDDNKYADDADLLRDLLPTAVDQEKFWLWVHTEDKLARTMPRAGEAKEYFDALAHTDYSNESSLRKLFAVLKAYVYPYIPAGSYNGYRYRISPSLTTLGPDDAQIDFDDTREFAAEPIIALNLVGKQIRCKDEKEDRNRQRRKDDTDSSYHSESSTESSTMGNNTTGFVCFQIGKLLAAREKYWSDNGKLPKGHDVGKIPWIPTDWVIVVVIDADNTSGAVWLLQNFEPTIENTSDQYMIDEADLYGWGYFEGELEKRSRPMQRGGVKIAHKITDLSETCQWTMDEYITGKYEILQAVIAARDTDRSPVIIRQFKKNNSSSFRDDSTPDVSGLSI